MFIAAGCGIGETSLALDVGIGPMSINIHLLQRDVLVL
jgi:hypothetical protein